MSAAGELREPLRHRAARRGRHHHGGARPPGVLRLRGRDRGGQGRDPGGPARRAAWPCSTATTRGCGAIGEAHARRAWSGSAATAPTTSPPRTGAAPSHGMRFDLRLGGARSTWPCPCPGPHFLSNFLAAAAVAHHLGLTPDAIAEAAARPEGGPPPRRRSLRLGQGVTAARRLLQLEPRRGGGGGGGARHGRPGAARGRCWATCWSWGPTGPSCTARRAAASRRKLDAAGRRGPAGARIPGGRARGRAGRPTPCARFADSAAAAAAAAPSCGRATPCS